MNKESRPPALDALTLTRLYSVLASQNERDEDPGRTKLLDSLAILRTQFPEVSQHIADGDLQKAAELVNGDLRLIEYLQMLERSSLGTPAGKQARRAAPARVVDDILARSDAIRDGHHEPPLRNGPGSRRGSDPSAAKPATDKTTVTPEHPQVAEHAQPWDGMEGTERHSACLTAARAGNQAGLSVLVAELTPLVWHVARGRGLDRSTAEDVVQTVWLALIGHLDRLAQPRALVGWLITTTRREALRVWNTRSDSAIEEPQIDTSSATTDSQPEDLTLQQERDKKLWAAFNRLPQRCQELLRLTVLAGRAEYRAVAEALHMPHGSIGPTRGRCLTALRALLEEEGESR